MVHELGVESIVEIRDEGHRKVNDGFSIQRRESTENLHGPGCWLERRPWTGKEA